MRVVTQYINRRRSTMGDISTGTSQNGKKQILLNAFDMSTVGHLSPGQWKVRISTPHPAPILT